MRPFRRGDAAAIARYGNDEEYRRYLSPTHPGAEKFVAHNVGINWSVERSWVITLESDIVGSVFLGINADDNAAELACLVARDFWGRGSASKRRVLRSSTRSSSSSWERRLPERMLVTTPRSE